MPRIAVEVTDGFRVVCEMQQRSMAAQARMILEAYAANEDIRQAVSRWHERAVAKALAAPVVAVGATIGPVI